MSGLPEGTYRLMSDYGAFYVAVRGHGTQAGARIELQRREPPQLRQSQMWVVDRCSADETLKSLPDAKDSYVLRNERSGLCLHAADHSKDAAHPVDQWDPKNDSEEDKPSSAWRIEKIPDTESTYAVINARSGHRLTVEAFSGKVGAALQQLEKRDDRGNSFQKWEFDAASLKNPPRCGGTGASYRGTYEGTLSRKLQGGLTGIEAADRILTVSYHLKVRFYDDDYGRHKVHVTFTRPQGTHVVIHPRTGPVQPESATDESEYVLDLTRDPAAVQFNARAGQSATIGQWYMNPADLDVTSNASVRKWKESLLSGFTISNLFGFRLEAVEPVELGSTVPKRLYESKEEKVTGAGTVQQTTDLTRLPDWTAPSATAVRGRLPAQPAGLPAQFLAWPFRPYPGAWNSQSFPCFSNVSRKGPSDIRREMPRPSMRAGAFLCSPTPGGFPYRVRTGTGPGTRT